MNSLTAIFSIPRLTEAWDKVRRNKGCAGTDGMTIDDMAKQPENYLEVIRESIVTQRLEIC